MDCFVVGVESRDKDGSSFLDMRYPVAIASDEVAAHREAKAACERRPENSFLVLEARLAFAGAWRFSEYEKTAVGADRGGVIR